MFETAEVVDIWIVLLSIGAFQVYLQLNSWDRNRFHEGLPKLMQVLTGIPALMVLVIFLFDPDLPVPAATSQSGLSDLGGVVLFNAAGLLILWSHVSLGDCWSGELETKADHYLVTAGPYRWVRHPLYSSYILLTAGLFLLSDNWWVGLAMLAYFLSVAARTTREEAMMLECLGVEYAAYQRRTGRFLPKTVFWVMAGMGSRNA